MRSESMFMPRDLDEEMIPSKLLQLQEGIEVKMFSYSYLREYKAIIRLNEKHTHLLIEGLKFKNGSPKPFSDSSMPFSLKIIL